MESWLAALMTTFRACTVAAPIATFAFEVLRFVALAPVPISSAIAYESADASMSCVWPDCMTRPTTSTTAPEPSSASVAWSVVVAAVAPVAATAAPAAATALASRSSVLTAVMRSVWAATCVPLEIDAWTSSTSSPRPSVTSASIAPTPTPPNAPPSALARAVFVAVARIETSASAASVAFRA